MTTVRRARRSAFFLLSVANAVNQSNRELTAAASPPPKKKLFHILKGDIKDDALYIVLMAWLHSFPLLSFPGYLLSQLVYLMMRYFAFVAVLFFSGPVASVGSLTQPARRGI